MNAAAKLFLEDDSGFRIASAGILFVCAEVIKNPSDTTEQGLKNAFAFIDGVMSMARDSGFLQWELLRELLMKCDTSERTVSLAQQACIAAGQKQILNLFRGMESEADHAPA